MKMIQVGYWKCTDCENIGWMHTWKMYFRKEW